MFKTGKTVRENYYVGGRCIVERVDNLLISYNEDITETGACLFRRVCYLYVKDEVAERRSRKPADWRNTYLPKEYGLQICPSLHGRYRARKVQILLPSLN